MLCSFVSVSVCCVCVCVCGNTTIPHSNRNPLLGIFVSRHGNGDTHMTTTRLMLVVLLILLIICGTYVEVSNGYLGYRLTTSTALRKFPVSTGTAVRRSSTARLSAWRSKPETTNTAKVPTNPRSGLFSIFGPNPEPKAIAKVAPTAKSMTSRISGLFGGGTRTRDDVSTLRLGEEENTLPFITYTAGGVVAIGLFTYLVNRWQMSRVYSRRITEAAKSALYKQVTCHRYNCVQCVH
jgi:hypothetical protein